MRVDCPNCGSHGSHVLQGCLPDCDGPYGRDPRAAEIADLRAQLAAALNSYGQCSELLGEMTKERDKSDETRKLNREMVEEVLRAESPERNSEDAYIARVLEKLFGPKKPREWTVFIDDGYIHSHAGRAGMEKVRVREVLDE